MSGFRLSHITHTDWYFLGGAMADLLTQASREIMVHMVAMIFSRLGELPVLDLSAEDALSLAHSPRLAVGKTFNSVQSIAEVSHISLPP